MGNKLILILLGIFLIGFVSAGNLSIFPNNILLADSYVSYEFNFSSTNDCDPSNIIFSYRKVVYLDSRGLGHISINISNLSSVPLKLCEYRNSVLRKNHSLPSAIFSTLYSQNLNLSNNLIVQGSVNITNNITANYGFFDYLGSLADKITKLWVKNINVSEYIYTNLTNGSVLFIGDNGQLLENNTAFYFEHGNGGKLAIGDNTKMRNMFQVVKSEGTTNIDSIKALITSRNRNTGDGTFAGFSFQTVDTDGDVYSGARIMTNFTSHVDDAVSGDLLFETRNAGTRNVWMTLKSNGSLYVGNSTDYTEIKSDGEILLHGDARVTRHLRVGAASWDHGASAPTEGHDGPFVYLAFDSAVDDEVHYTVIVPYRWDRSIAVEFVCDWYYTGAQDNGTVNWALEYKAIKAGEIVTGGSTTINQTSAGTHTTGQMVRTTFTTKILASNLESGDTLAFKLYRDVSEDDLGTNVRLLNTHFHFTQDKLGRAT